MKLRETYGGYMNKQSGTIDGMYYEKRLGKITSVSDLQKRNSWRVLNNKAVDIVINLDIIEKRSENVTKVNLDNSLLSTSFEAMYGSALYSDYTLVTADGEDIPVHKNVLASRSQVFAAMMETKLKEGEEKKAVIDDIDSKSLKEFLRFLYCGRVNEIETVATDLIHAAEKYGLKDLKPLCVQSMIKTISMDNAIETFIIADLHGESYLKKFSLDYIMWNYEELKDHESWKKLTTNLYKEILDFAAINDKSINCVRLTTSINIVQATPVPVQRAPVQPTVAVVAAAVQRVANAVQRLNVNANAQVVNPNVNAQVANPNVNAQAANVNVNAQVVNANANAQAANNVIAAPRLANAVVP